jgi:poly(A) polymerase
MPRPNLDKVREALRGTEFEGRAWLVGGSVRDRLLHRKTTADVDIVVTGDAAAAAEALWKMSVADAPPVTYPRFGTSMVQVDGAKIEFATARRESYTDDSRKPEVAPATIEDDARRRDFTVNALLEDLYTGEVLDPLGQGRHDLEHRVLRTPLEPRQTFYDDPLRMLRAVRFVWQLGFEPAEGLYEAVRDEAKRLLVISAERINEELTKMLRLADGHECLRDLMDLGLMRFIAPELEEGVGMDQGPYHHLDVWSHTVEVVANTDPRDLTLRLAALFHDVAKPRCRVVRDGKTTFYGHDEEGARMTREIMGRLRFPTETIEDAARLVRHHMRFLGMREFTESAARRVLRDLGDQTEQFVELCEADSAAHAPGVRTPDFAHIRDVLVRVAERTPPETLESPISGDRIMEVTGLPEGEEVGRVKQHLADLVVEGKLLHTDIEGAEREARRFVGNRPNV